MPETVPSNQSDEVRQALDRLGPPAEPDLEMALRRQLSLQQRTTFKTGFRERTSFVQIASRGMGPLSRPAFSIPVAAVLVLAISLTIAPVRGFAAQFLTIFRVQQVTPITLTPSSPIPDLSKFGDMEGQAAPNFGAKRVDSLAAASSSVGFSVQTPSVLPNNLPGQPSAIAVTQPETVGFTFREAKAKAYLASTGHADFSMPAKFDGASLQLHIEPAVILGYLPAGKTVPSSSADAQAQLQQARASGEARPGDVANAVIGNGVVLMETKSPSVDAQGVSADELRDFLLSLPGLPPATAEQLRAIGDWRNTLPIPAAPGANLQKTQVNGASAVIGTNMQMHVIVWVNNGIVYGAAGSQVSNDDLMKLASSVR